MTTMGTLVNRVKYTLRDPPADTDSPAWLRSTVATQLDDAFMHLARRGLWGQIAIVQAVLDRTIYPLQEQATYIATGRDNGGATGNATELTDTTAAFVTAGVVVDDVLRNFTDGSRGKLTTVTATVLTCSAGFSGGTANVVDTGDLYMVERAAGLAMVVGIDAVLYNGYELPYVTEATLEKRLGAGWETIKTEPKYWTVDNTLNPTVLKVVPAPRVTGSTIPVIPMVPLPLPWADNFVLFYREHPDIPLSDGVDVPMMEVFQDIAVWKAVQALSDNEGDNQDLSVALVARELAALWMKQLGLS